MEFIQEIKLIHENAIVPSKGSELAACFDLYSIEDQLLKAGTTLAIRTGVCVAWYDTNYYMKLESRSGMAVKGITVEAGVIDIDYRKEIKVVLCNRTPEDYIICSGNRIAQYTFVRISNPITKVVDDFSCEVESSRTGGFGSTGI